MAKDANFESSPVPPRARELVAYIVVPPSCAREDDRLGNDGSCGAPASFTAESSGSRCTVYIPTTMLRYVRSVVARRLLDFRKRPTETPSRLGLKTATYGCGACRPSSLKQSRRPRPDQHCGIATNILSLLHKESRVTCSLHPFRLCLLVSFFRHIRDKAASLDNGQSQRPALTKNNIQQGTNERLAAAKNSVPEVRQSASAAGSRTRYCLL